MADLIFDQFRFDPATECLWQGAQLIALTPKSYAVLRCLLERHGQLVSKDALLDAAWPDTAVSDASLKVCIQEIRRALGDQVAAPRFIATVHRRGYRFIATVAGGPDGHRAGADARATAGDGPAAPPAAQRAPDLPLVGRHAQLADLQRTLERALAGERQIVFVTGELGIGKTALVDAFLARVAAAGGVAIARGRCLEHFGTGEPYLPVLEALGRLCRDQAGNGAVALLRERAPTWLAQMPWLIAEADREALRLQIFGGTRERMLRELGEALDGFTARTPLVLVLEDLHWSDPSTLDAVALLAQQRQPAALLLLATYRPVDAILAGHPVKDLKQRLTVQSQGSELGLDFLTPADVDAYLAGRLGAAAPAGLADVVHRRTDGNPLFMVMVVDDLLAAGRLITADGRWTLRDGLDVVAAAVPDGIRDMVERQIERLAAEDVALLETAALAWGDFSAAQVAAALELSALAVERRCEELARQQHWVRAQGVAELTNGTVSGTYGFTHRLYQSVFGERVPAARRLRLHQRIGEWLEHAVGERAALELAMHFEQSRDHARAIRYLRAGARTAAARCANREAVAELTHALELVERLPAGEQGAVRRALLERRGLAYNAMGDVAAAIEDLGAWATGAGAEGAADEEVRALLALSAAWSLRDRARCLEFAEAAVERSRTAADPDMHVRARGYAAYWYARVHGWRASDAQASVEAVATARRSGHAGGLAAQLGMQAYFANLQSDYGGAARAAAEGMILAERASDGFAHALCQYQHSWALLHAGEWGVLLGVLHAALRAAERNGHEPWGLVFTLVLGWWAIHAGDAAAAARRAAESLRTARSTRHEFGTLLGQLVSGWAELGRGAVGAARRRFDAVADGAVQRPLAMEWVLNLPLHVGRSACALAAGDAPDAAREAERVCQLAAQPGERTYLALGHRGRAAAAIAQRQWDEAADALAAAQAALDGGTAPLAEWQVWGTAAALADATGDRRAAAAHRGRRAAVLERLALSLDGVDETTTAALGVSIADAQRSIRALV